MSIKTVNCDKAVKGKFVRLKKGSELGNLGVLDIIY